jgi:hypothetical protein
MLLLEFSSSYRQSVALVQRMVKLPVNTLHLGAGLTKMPMRLLKLPAKRAKLEAETICFGARLLQVMGNVRIERLEKVCFGLGSRHFVIRSYLVRRFGHSSIRFWS